MPLLLIPDLDILGTIKQFDKLLKEMDIVPVLEYKNICYQLKIDGNAFMTITLSANHISFEKLYQPENNEKFNAAFNRIAAFIFSLREVEILQAG